MHFNETPHRKQRGIEPFYRTGKLKTASGGLKMKYILLFAILFLLAGNIYTQSKRNENSKGKKISFLEKNVIYGDSTAHIFISYRIPYKLLVFEKNNGEYFGRMSLDLNIQQAGKIVLRQSSSKGVQEDSYDKTKSSTDYIEGIIQFDLKKGEYAVIPYLNFIKGDESIQLDSVHIQPIDFENGKILSPIIVKRETENCGKQYGFRLINTSNTIPFSSSDYTLLIPAVNESISSINVLIEQDKKEIIKKDVNKFITAAFTLTECNGHIVIDSSSHEKKIKYFLLDGFSSSLNEGSANFRIRTSDEKPSEFNREVFWSNKPKSLMNPEFAIQLLDIIAGKAKVDTMLDANEKNYENELNNFWAVKNPNKSIIFNELEAEFYHRADYAAENFKTIDNNNGSKSDRGKIYIRYGKPDEIKRDYSNPNAIVEVWKYNRVDKEFIFTDISGLGNYTLGQ
jgi:GWxTD domain-containing protein